MTEQRDGGRLPAGAPVLVGTAVVAAGCWIVSVRQMRGMDMGFATSLGSFASFTGLWAAMMAAMMLPAALPAIAAFVRAGSRPVAGAWFVASYLAVWAVFGAAAFLLYRQHGSVAAGALTIPAGLYELTPLKRTCRRRCREEVRSGCRFGVYCVGSSIGLMAIMFALGVMNVVLMTAVAAVVLAQKLLPPRASVDIPLALAIVAVGAAVIAAPVPLAT
jgi:predicted metal-binding membrane protein